LVKLCTALTEQNRNECMKPVVQDSPISLCALHLLLASDTVQELGGNAALIPLVRADGIGGN